MNGWFIARPPDVVEAAQTAGVQGADETRGGFREAPSRPAHYNAAVPGVTEEAMKRLRVTVVLAIAFALMALSSVVAISAEHREPECIDPHGGAGACRRRLPAADAAGGRGAARRPPPGRHAGPHRQSRVLRARVQTRPRHRGPRRVRSAQRKRPADHRGHGRGARRVAGTRRGARCREGPPRNRVAPRDPRAARGRHERADPRSRPRFLLPRRRDGGEPAGDGASRQPTPGRDRCRRRPSTRSGDPAEPHRHRGPAAGVAGACGDRLPCGHRGQCRARAGAERAGAGVPSAGDGGD